jgi:hypothetical protein
MSQDRLNIGERVRARESGWEGEVVQGPDRADLSDETDSRDGALYRTVRFDNGKTLLVPIDQLDQIESK